MRRNFSPKLIPLSDGGRAAWVNMASRSEAMRRYRNWAQAVGLTCGLLLVAGCALLTQEQRLLAESGLRQHDPAFHGSDDAVKAGKVHFRNGDWGLAEENFRRAVELTPTDAEAWLGLAASYDRLRRFDLADRAYGNAIRLVGYNAVILNNLGYSSLLRGDMVGARRNFLQAYEMDPTNPYILNNLELLEASGKALARRPT
jgi:Flp pilus assembly protein TadD